jgi:hypothetical protein
MVKLNDSKRYNIQLHLLTNLVDFTPKEKKMNEKGKTKKGKKSWKQKHHLSWKLYKAKNFIFQAI